MDQGTDRITEDVKSIISTRTSIADTLQLIERRLVETVEEAKTQTEKVIDQTQASVQEAVESVQEALETVKTATDPRRVAQEHPWLLLGGAIAVGFVLHKALQSSGRSGEGGHLVPVRRERATASPMPAWSPSQATAPTLGVRASMMDDVRHVVAQEFDQIKGELAALAGGMFRSWLRETMRTLVVSDAQNRASGYPRSRGIGSRTEQNGL